MTIKVYGNDKEPIIEFAAEDVRYTAVEHKSYINSDSVMHVTRKATKYLVVATRLNHLEQHVFDEDALVMFIN